jgi:hypothetical protein
MPHTLLWWARARYELTASSRKSADKYIADGVALFEKYVSFELTCEIEYKTTRAEAGVLGEIPGNLAPSAGQKHWRPTRRFSRPRLAASPHSATLPNE